MGKIITGDLFNFNVYTECNIKLTCLNEIYDDYKRFKEVFVFFIKRKWTVL